MKQKLLVLQNPYKKWDAVVNKFILNTLLLNITHLARVARSTITKVNFLTTRVDLHTPKMLIIQFHTSSVWENACHTIFIHFLKMVENWYKLFSVAV